jgi:parallel beta-helix repeat protein
MISSSNKIMRNNITSNGQGIYLNQVAYNRIYHNNFIDNGMPAVDDTFTNFWNDTYPSGGNYWSTYAGADVLKGPARNIPGEDGLGDTPFFINPNVMDEYPLMGPYAPGAPPLPATNVNAQLNGQNSENVTITWDLSGDDSSVGTGEDDVFGYAVYHSTDFSTSRENYRFLDFVVNGTNTYVHPGGGEGDPNNNFYCVKTWAVDRIGNSSTNQVGKFTRALQSGQHLVSIPLVQSDEDVDVVLKTLKFNSVWHYDNSDVVDPWKSYVPFAPFNDLVTVNHTMALWIDVTEDSNLTVAGVVPSVTDIWLKSGWNRLRLLDQGPLGHPVDPGKLKVQARLSFGIDCG